MTAIFKSSYSGRTIINLHSVINLVKYVIKMSGTLSFISNVWVSELLTYISNIYMLISKKRLIHRYFSQLTYYRKKKNTKKDELAKLNKFT